MSRAPRSPVFWLWCWMAAPLAATLAAHGSARAADPAPHASTAAERQARGEEAARNFVLGRYEEALATYLDLYIQSDGRAEYLRNIGRCQQKLKQYPRAIESFKDYLKRARHLGADERKEVQGFIADIEAEMKAGNGATQATAAPMAIKPAPPAMSPPSPAPGPAPAPAQPAQAYLAPAPPVTAQPWPAPQPPPATGTQPPPSGPPPSPNPAVAYNGGPPPSLAAPAAAPPDLVSRPPEATGGEAHTSPLRVVGIISVVAAAAAAAGGTLALLNARSTFDDASKNGCPGANSKTYCDSKANAVGSANTLSKILFVSAALVGVAGVTMLVVAPSPTPDGRVSLAVSGRF